MAEADGVIAGLGIALSGIVTQQQRADVVANNLANANSDGFQADRPGSAALPANRGAIATSLGRDGTPGPLQPTGRPLDVAITGGAWLQVAGPNGQVALTKAGSLRLDCRGQLVTSSGDRLVPPVRVPAGTDESTMGIATDGTVTAAGRTVGRIQPVTVPAPAGLMALPGTKYAPTVASGPPQPAAGATVQQGVLEGSNVDDAQSIVDLDLTRTALEVSVAAARTQDEVLAATLGIVR